jgi:ABC-type transport system involved in multi-copper enzyme maturation permease subunit
MGIAYDQGGLLFAMVLVLSAMLPVSSIAYDERCKWDKIANTAPLSRKEIVMAKYLFAILLTVFSVAVCFVIYLFDSRMPMTEKLIMCYMLTMGGMLYQALLLPVNIKFGAEKGRNIMLAIMFVPVLLVVAVSNTGLVDLPAVVQFLENNEQLIPYIVTATVAVAYAASVTLSVKIYENKDL